jgi:phytoene dehydrogenase-like protein
MPYDAVVLGAGPAGLGAALALARDGARVALLEAANHVGGLCATLARDGVSYDLGGHILFVHDEARRTWLEALLGDDLLWVPRPVACLRDGTIAAGRYLDQRPRGGGVGGGRTGRSARDALVGRFGDGFVDATMRRYLEKIDGMPLERIVAQRAIKLLMEQRAPEGFWYPAGGIGQLMDAMADEIRALGGEVILGARVQSIALDGDAVSGVEADAAGGPVTLRSSRIVAGLPPALVAGLVSPHPPRGLIAPLPPRAAAIVYLEVAEDRLSEHAWIQVDDPAAPFARLFEAKNWSERLVPQGRTVLGCECYCSPRDDDPAWGLDDAALGAACAGALADLLGLVGDRTAAATREVVRIPRAWSLVDVDAVDAAGAPGRWLDGIDGLTVAQGGDVVLAIAAGERAAA